MAEVITTASSIPRHTDCYAMPWNSPFAMESAACCRKRGIVCFLLRLYLIQSFSGSFLILPVIKQ